MLLLEAPPAVAAGDLARGARGGANADRLDDDGDDEGDEPLLVDIARARIVVGDRVGGNANMIRSRRRRVRRDSRWKRKARPFISMRACFCRKVIFMVWVENLIGNFDGLKNRSMFDGTAAYPTRLRVKVDVKRGSRATVVDLQSGKCHYLHVSCVSKALKARRRV